MVHLIGKPLCFASGKTFECQCFKDILYIIFKPFFLSLLYLKIVLNVAVLEDF